MATDRIVWSLLWKQKNKLDGITQHLINENCVPVLFNTRKKARIWADENYGYIRTRKDLREEPHCWRVPTAVRVKVSICGKGK